MKKVFNLRIECNSPTFVMTDKDFCQGLEEIVADEFDEEMKYVKLKEEPCDKDKEIGGLKTSIDYWKNEVFKKMEVKLAGVTKEKIQEIRKQVCDEIRQKLKEAELMYVWKGKDKSIETIIDQIEKGE